LGLDYLICTATDLENTLLRRQADPARVAILRMGVGPVNAAHAVTLAIAGARPKGIIVCGIGGAYPDSGLAIGDVASAESECYGDLGASSPAGFLDMQAIGFPIVEGPHPIYNVLPLQLFPSPRRVRFVTMSTCTGVSADARAIATRTGGAVENMEGAAVAHVAAIHGIPAGEIRGISNMVTDRDTKTWRVKEAATAAQEALLSWLAQL
jgi:futalosine hydrolase